MANLTGGVTRNDQHQPARERDPVMASTGWCWLYPRWKGYPKVQPSSLRVDDLISILPFSSMRWVSRKTISCSSQAGPPLSQDSAAILSTWQHLDVPQLPYSSLEISIESDWFLRRDQTTLSAHDQPSSASTNL